MSKERILIVEDNYIVAETIKDMLLEFGYDIEGHSVTAEDAVDKAGKLNPHLILMDINLKGERNGFDAACDIRRFSMVPIIYVTAYAECYVLKNAAGTEPYSCIIKPIMLDEFESHIKQVLDTNKQTGQK